MIYFILLYTEKRYPFHIKCQINPPPRIKSCNDFMKESYTLFEFIPRCPEDGISASLQQAAGNSNLKRNQIQRKNESGYYTAFRDLRLIFLLSSLFGSVFDKSR